VGKTQRSVLARQDQRLTDIAVTARVDVRLQREPQDLTAATL
jgi:hypothetical protein